MKHQTTSLSTLKPTNFNVSTQNSNVMEMGMDVENGNQNSAFFLLSSTLYKEPYRAIIRELVSNAIDASKAANETKPVILHIPSSISANDNFYVQDFGIGMTLEHVINIYGNYFSSSKQNDSNSIGGFGLGGKTPFIYVKDKTDGFKLETTSPEDGVRRTFVFKMQTNQYGGLQPVYSYLENLDEVDSPTKGTKISFKLDNMTDIVHFSESIQDIIFSSYPIAYKGVFERSSSNGNATEASNSIFKKILQRFNIKTKYEQIVEKLKNNELIKLDNDFSYINLPIHPINTHKNKTIISLILGNVFYQYPIDFSDTHVTLLEKLKDIHQVINKIDKNHVYNAASPIFKSDNNGKITFSLSREAIQDNQYNNDIIQNLVTDYLNKEIQIAQDLLKQVINNNISNIQISMSKNRSLRSNVKLYFQINNLIKLHKQKCINLSKTNLSLLKSLMQSSFIDVEKLSKIFLFKIDCYGMQQSYVSLLYNLLNPKLDMDFFILDNAEQLFNHVQYGADFIGQFIYGYQNNHFNSHKYYILTKEQFDLLKTEDYFAKQPIDFNGKVKQILKQIEHKKEVDQIKYDKKAKQNEKLLKDLKDNKIKKIIYNENEIYIPNGIQTIDFERELYSSLSNPSSIMFPKKLGLNINIKPILLPEKLKFSFDFLTIDNPNYIKNTKFLLNINPYMFNSMYIHDVNRSVYIRHGILNKLSKNNIRSKYDIRGIKKMLKSVSRAIPFEFVKNMDLDLQKVDLLDYLHNEITERFTYVQETILNMDLNQYIKNNIKNYMVVKLLNKNIDSNPIVSTLQQLYQPFINLIHPYESKSISNMMDNKLTGFIDKLIQSYFKDNDVWDNYTICDELKHFFNVLNEYHVFFGHPDINFYSFDDFMKISNDKIARKISEIYSVNKYKGVHFPYSKQFYQDYVKDIVGKLI